MSVPITQQYYEVGEQVEVKLGQGWVAATVVSAHPQRRFGGPWIYEVKLESGKFEQFTTGRGIRKLKTRWHSAAERGPH